MFKKIEGIYNVGKTVFKKLKGNKVKNPETVNPFQRKTMRSDAAAKMGDIKVQLGKLKGGAKKLQTSVEDVKAAMRDRAKGKKRVYSGKELEQQEYFKYKKARVKKMGGGMMGRRMGYASGTLKPIPEGNKGLPKLPKEVRNKMGFLKSGGKV